MRINSNKRIHKMKRDPYQTLLRMAGILAVVVVVGFGVFFLCRTLIENEFVARRTEMERSNIEAEQEFNAKMNNLRSSAATGNTPMTEEEQGDLPFWEVTIGENLWRMEDEGRAGLENTSIATLERADLINGGLLLVNPWHALPSDFSDTALISISTTSNYQIQAENNSVRLFPNAYDALSAMIKDAKEAGLEDYIVYDAFRSQADQQALFDGVAEELSKDYSGDILIEQAKKKVNYPGTSDYQSGLSFRVSLYPIGKGVKFQQSEQGKWMTENCWKYGVIFRFPTMDFPNSSWEDKSYKTGVSSTLNMYRYVGKAHSTAMRIMGYCLEEYIEFLIDHPHLCIYEDGALRYEIFRIPTDEVLETYDVPITNPSSEHQASLDNMGGVVMAYTYH